MPILNRPRRPQDNAKVERAQGTTSRWAELDTCPNVQVLQVRLNDLVEIQREHYPVKRLGNVSRGALHKNLHAVQRPFNRLTFNEAKAYEHLAKASYPRKVSSSGSINLYGHQFQAGLSQKGKTVLVKFDPPSIGWLVLGENGQYLKTLHDPRFSGENLSRLNAFP